MKLRLFAWTFSIIVCALSLTAWGQMNSWQLAGLSTYQIFPLFGLLAYSLMIGHYVVAAVRQALGIDKTVVQRYFEATSWAVLVLICLHPGLLIWQLWRDGAGLPPGSYGQYVGSALKWVAVLGTVSLLIFFAYELRRWFGKRPWWRFVGYASDLAMLAIFYHGLRLGSTLQSGWFYYVWLLYGAFLGSALVYMHTVHPRRPSQRQAHAHAHPHGRHH
jgi:hypothetical protein